MLALPQTTMSLSVIARRGIIITPVVAEPTSAWHVLTANTSLWQGMLLSALIVLLVDTWTSLTARHTQVTQLALTA